VVAPALLGASGGDEDKVFSRSRGRGVPLSDADFLLVFFFGFSTGEELPEPPLLPSFCAELVDEREEIELFEVDFLGFLRRGSCPSSVGSGDSGGREPPSVTFSMYGKTWLWQ